ncbi:MAG: hypothetical protein GY750_08925 [Lentisphaerae bacterium]|nr:hypothetical protein [Lentisphaerota bacterium]MCP4101533.1 hypothetical protein [Lentisphaerota bacterium]
MRDVLKNSGVIDLRPKCKLPSFVDYRKVMVIDKEINFRKFDAKGDNCFCLLDLPASCEIKVYINVLKEAGSNEKFSLCVEHSARLQYLFSKKNFNKKGFLDDAPSSVLNTCGTLVLKIDYLSGKSSSAKLKFACRVTELD